MTVIERSFSDLLRNPKEVTADVDTADVLLRRRDEPDLRLSRADREADRNAAFTSLTRALRDLATHRPDVLAEALHDAFPWLELLPAEERTRFVGEFWSMAAAAGSVESFAPLAQLLTEWRSTAEIYAQPALFEALITPIDGEGDRVPRPHG